MESFTSCLNPLPNCKLKLQCAGPPPISHCPGTTCPHRLHSPDPRNQIHHFATLALLLDQAESPTIPPPPPLPHNPCLACALPPQSRPPHASLPPSWSRLPPIPPPTHSLPPPRHLQLPFPQGEVCSPFHTFLALLIPIYSSHNHLGMGSACYHILPSLISPGFLQNVLNIKNSLHFSACPSTSLSHSSSSGKSAQNPGLPFLTPFPHQLPLSLPWIRRKLVAVRRGHVYRGIYEQKL